MARRGRQDLIRRVHELATFDGKILADFLTHRVSHVATNPDSDASGCVASGPVPDGRPFRDRAPASSGPCALDGHAPDVATNDPRPMGRRISDVEASASVASGHAPDGPARVCPEEPCSSTANIEHRTSHLEPSTSNIEPRTSNLERLADRLTPHAILAGFDEAGRGALAGTIVK